MPDSHDLFMDDGPPACKPVDMSLNDVCDSVHFYILLDASSSMAGQPIRQLNDSMPDLLSGIRRHAAQKEVVPLVHMLRFDSEIHWLFGSTATCGVPASLISWCDLTAGGEANTGAAIEAIMEGMNRRHLGYQAYPPVILLVSSGACDSADAVCSAIRELRCRMPASLRIAAAPEGSHTGSLEDFASMGTIDVTDDLGNVLDSRYDRLLFPLERLAEVADYLSSLVVTS